MEHSPACFGLSGQTGQSPERKMNLFTRLSVHTDSSMSAKSVKQMSLKDELKQSSLKLKAFSYIIFFISKLSDFCKV